IVIGDLVERAGRLVEERGWRPLSDEEQEAYEEEEPADDASDVDASEIEEEALELLTLDTYLVGAGQSPWWQGGNGIAYFQARPFDETVRHSDREPVLQVGVHFGLPGGPYPSARWFERLDARGFSTTQNEGTEALAEIWKS